MTREQRQAVPDCPPGWVPSWLVPTRAIVLGLDLQGGSHVLLEVDVPDLMRTQTTQLRDDVRRVLRETRVVAAGRHPAAPARRPDPRRRTPPTATRSCRSCANSRSRSATRSSARAAIATSRSPTTPDGLIQLTYTEAGVNEKVRRAVDQAIEVIRRRVDALGTTEPNIQRQGADRILVQVPGLQDPQRLKDDSRADRQARVPPARQAGATDVDMLPMRGSGRPARAGRAPRHRRGRRPDRRAAGLRQRTNQPIVNFRFNIRGAQRFGQATTENVGRPLAIVLDNEVISAPTIQTPITGGSGQISGRFTVQQANNLAVLLRAGALPAKLTIVEERTVGPGLGAIRSRPARWRPTWPASS